MSWSLTDAEVYDARTSIGHNGLLASVAVAFLILVLAGARIGVNTA